MLKKLIIALIAVAVLSVPAMAIEPPAGAKIPWGGNNTAYTPAELNKVLEAYGLKLSTEAAKGTPSSYATVAGDKVKFKHMATAYRPSAYHSILTAYGLELTPEEVNAKLGSMTYASVKDGKVVFGRLSTAYNRSEWKTILSAYSLPTPAKMESAKAMPGDSDGDGVADDKDACPGTPKGVTVDDRGCWSYPTKLLFDFDKADLKGKYHAALHEAKPVLAESPTMKVQINGYTCDLGSASYNQGLSERRAKAVRDYLVNTVGVDPNRLTMVGHGESNPAYPNDTDENRQKNRRVEFVPKM